MKTTVYLVLAVTLFIIVAGALYAIFGSANCESTANMTATNLKDKINIVADPGFPSYTDDNVPTNSMYYQETMIRLCQENTKWSYLISFWGGMPEYQIYYEQFPEGFFGGGSYMWTEDYPWSGGAGSTFVFWGALKAGSFVFKKVAYALAGKVKLAAKFLTWSYGYKMNRIAKLYGMQTEDFIRMLVDDPTYRSFFKSTRDVSYLAKILAREDAKMGTDMLSKVGVLATKDGEIQVVENVVNGKRAGKLLLSGEEKALTIPRFVTELDEVGHAVTKLDEYEVWIKRSTAGVVLETQIVDPKTAIPADLLDQGFKQEMVNPAQAMKEYITDIAKSGKEGRAQARQLMDMYAFPEEAEPGKLTKLSAYGLENTALYQNVYDPAKTKFAAIVKAAETAGFKTKQTTMDGMVLSGLIKSMENDPEDVMKLIKPSLTEKLMIKLGITNAEELTAQKLTKLMGEIEPNMAGVAFLHESSMYNIDRMIAEEVKNNPTISFTELTNKVKQMDTYQKYFAQGMEKELTDDELFSMITSVQIHKDLLADGTVKGTVEFEEKINTAFLRKLADDLDSSNPAIKARAQDEADVFMAFLEQNTEMLPAPAYVKAGHKEARKLMYLYGTSMINPNSGVMKQFVGQAMTEYCEGNSMCVYSHATQTEAPFYMSEKADNYFIRLWRPVPTLMYTSLQGNLMHPTKDPRFYLVSPCFGRAKIWKVDNYEDGPTIFVTVEKCDTGTSNYCYADEGLLNEYAVIWDASDYGTIAAGFVTLGTSEIFATVCKVGDPITIMQGFAEAAVSWPGYPWEDMVYQSMSGDSLNACAGKGLKEELEKVRGIKDENE